MPWFKVDDNLAFHAKVMAAGNPAMGLWVRAGSWAAHQLTDGFVPDHMLPSLGTKGQADRLLAAGLWSRVEGGYGFHEWGERQPSRVDVVAEREAAKERMRKAREAKKAAKAQVSGSGSEDVRANFGRSSGDVRVTPTRPDPTRPDPKENVSTAVETRRSDVDDLCAHLADRIEANGSSRPTVTKSWRTAARLMLDKDGRTEHEIHGAIDWCQADEFWRSNILSMTKLREKYDQLRLQAQRANAPRRGRNDIDWEAAARRLGVTDGGL